MTILWIEIAIEKGSATALDALSLRNALSKKIADASLGKFLGGGVSLNGSSCDLEVTCSDPMATEQFVRTVLSDIAPTCAVTFATRQEGKQPAQGTGAA